jgi:glutathione synthase
MKHIIYIDPLEKLNLKKDSSLLLALSLLEKKVDVYILFEADLFWHNQKELKFKLHKFSGSIDPTFYISDFKLEDSCELSLNKNDIFWMRIDPPFDTRYLRYLWLQDLLTNTGVQVINSPKGIAINNEKLFAYKQVNAIPSYVGSDVLSFKHFLETLRLQKFSEVVLKPLDLYSGIGVTKHSLSEDLVPVFHKKLLDYQGMIVVQPFIKEVYAGEIRAIYFNGKHLGSILKKPKSGEFVSNIAHGGSFERVELSATLKMKCDQMAQTLLNENVPWIAFDALGDNITEANITCPGLLVEVSNAHGRNLAHELLNLM